MDFLKDILNIGLLQRVAQTDLNDVIEWSIVNKLPFNLSKCLHMTIMKSSAIYTSIILFSQRLQHTRILA